MLSAVSLSGIDVDPSLIISTPVPWRGRSWCGSQQEPGAFVPCSEPEHVAVFSLLSWSATISKSNSSYLYLFAVPVLFSATLNQNWTNMVRCQVPPDVFFYLSIIRYGAIHSEFILSQISEIYWRFLLHLISYSAAPRVANEDNVQYCEKNWLHLAYQDRRTRSETLWSK